MSSISPLGLLPLSSTLPRATAFRHQLLLPHPNSLQSSSFVGSIGNLDSRKPLTAAAAGSTLTTKSVSQPRNGVYTVGEFMTRKEELHVVKPTTTVDEALEALVEHRITGFPVIDDDWKLVLQEMIQTYFLKLTALGKLLMRYKSY